MPHEPHAGAPDDKAASTQRRRERLLAAAEAAFAERGFHRTSVKDIVERAGVATGTFYLYFPSKEASCLAVIDDVYRDLLAAVVRHRQGRPHVLAKLAASVVAAVETFARRPQAARIVFLQAPGAHPDFDRRLEEIQDELTALVARDVEEAVAEGLLPPQDAVLSARCLVGCLRELLLAWVRGFPEPAADRAASAPAADGLRGREAAGSGPSPLPPVVDPRDALPQLLAFTLRGLGAAPAEIGPLAATALSR